MRFSEVLYGVMAVGLALCWYADEAVRLDEGAGRAARLRAPKAPG